MNTTIRRFAAISTLAGTALVLTACGSSDDTATAPPTTLRPSTTLPSPAPTTTSDLYDDTTGSTIAVEGDSGNAIVYTDLKSALASLDTHASELPAAAKPLYDKLTVDVDHAEAATGEDALTEYATVKDDIDTLRDQLASSSDVSNAVTTAWNEVKSEFDRIDAGF